MAAFKARETIVVWRNSVCSSSVSLPPPSPRLGLSASLTIGFQARRPASFVFGSLVALVEMLLAPAPRPFAYFCGAASGDPNSGFQKPYSAPIRAKVGHAFGAFSPVSFRHFFADDFKISEHHTA